MYFPVNNGIAAFAAGVAAALAAYGINRKAP